MPPKPLFSIVIPLYNRAAEVKAAIHSILAQTEQNYEIIVVDDGSTDHPTKVLNTIPDPRLKVITQANAGGSAARNTGIARAQGQFIAFLDSDDTFLPHHLAQALPILQAHPQQVTYTQVIVNRGDDVTFLKPPRGIQPSENISEYLICERGFVQTSTLIVPAALAKQVLFNPALKKGQDTNFAIRLAAAGGIFTMLPKPGAIWNDQSRGGRMSTRSELPIEITWNAESQPFLTARAHAASCGWGMAKAYAHNGQRLKAARLYANALLRGCYKPKLALVIALQVFLSPAHYRQLADLLARFGLRP
jgi:hypothetical protein